MQRFAVSLSLVLLFTSLGACTRDDLHVTSIQLGRGLNADATVTGHTTRFEPDDAVYVSVLTAGGGSATIGVRWTYRGRVLGEPTKQVFYRDVAATEFRLQSPAGFPEGDYTVEAFLDGKPVGARDFRVEKKR